jgi:hypothetical protein
VNAQVPELSVHVGGEVLGGERHLVPVAEEAEHVGPRAGRLLLPPIYPP